MSQFPQLQNNVSATPPLAFLYRSFVQTFKRYFPLVSKAEKSISVPSLNTSLVSSNVVSGYVSVGLKMFLPPIRQLCGKAHSLVKCKHILDFSSHLPPYPHTYAQYTTHTTTHDSSEY